MLRHSANGKRVRYPVGVLRERHLKPSLPEQSIEKATASWEDQFVSLELCAIFTDQGDIGEVGASSWSFDPAHQVVLEIVPLQPEAVSYCHGLLLINSIWTRLSKKTLCWSDGDESQLKVVFLSRPIASLATSDKCPQTLAPRVPNNPNPVSPHWPWSTPRWQHDEKCE